MMRCFAWRGHGMRWVGGAGAHVGGGSGLK